MSTLGLWLAQEEFTTVSNCSWLAQTAISAPLVCWSSKKYKYHKAQNTVSTPQCARHTRVVIGKHLTPNTRDRGMYSTGRLSESALVTLWSLWRLWWFSWVDWIWKQLSAEVLKRNKRILCENNTAKKSEKHCPLFCETLYYLFMQEILKGLMLLRSEELHTGVGIFVSVCSLAYLSCLLFPIFFLLPGNIY